MIWFEEKCWINPANDSVFSLSLSFSLSLFLYPTLTFCFYFTVCSSDEPFYCFIAQEIANVKRGSFCLSTCDWADVYAQHRCFCSFMLFFTTPSLLFFIIYHHHQHHHDTIPFPLLCAKHAIFFVPWVNSPREGRNGSLSNVQMSLIFKFFLSLLS